SVRTISTSTSATPRPASSPRCANNPPAEAPAGCSSSPFAWLKS
ncbi:uncharacterized protein METZ01_LOCUS263206, partial [marine metagenome]